MIWPPVKAWTSKKYIEGQRHFVAINYGGKKSERWVIFMSVIDSAVVVRVAWPKLVDLSYWECGWDKNHFSDSPEVLKSEYKKRAPNCSQLSVDSGLTIPITKNFIRSWF